MRLLLIEDRESRYLQFKKWLPPEARLVWVKSGGAALRTLSADDPDDYDGVLLDYDLQRQTVTPGEERVNGGVVARRLIEKRWNHVPVLVHSMNMQEGPGVADALAQEGFEVTRIPYVGLTKDAFTSWVKSCES